MVVEYRNSRCLLTCLAPALLLLLHVVTAAQDAAPPTGLEPGKEYLALGASEGWVVSDVVLRRSEAGRVSNAPPRSIRRSDVLGVMRAQVNRGALLADDVARDVQDLVQTHHYFSQVEPWLEIENRETRRLKLILVCVEPPIASIAIRVLDGGWFQPAPPDITYEVRSALSLHEGEAYSIDAMDEDIRTRLFDGQKYIDIKEERSYAPDGVHVTLRLVRSRSVDRVALAGIFGMSRSTIETSLKLGEYRTANPHLIAKVDQTLRDTYLAEGYAFVDVTHDVIVIPAAHGRPLRNDQIRKAVMRENPTLQSDQLDQLMQDAKEGETVLLVTVHEGPRVLVGNVVFEGIDQLVDLPGSATLMPGTLPSSYWPLWYAMPWTTRPSRVERALYRVMEHGPTFFSPKPDFILAGAVQDASFVQQHLRKAGWLDASVTLRDVRYNDDRSRCELVYGIEPGPLYLLTGIALNVKTKPPLATPSGGPEPQVVSDEEIWNAFDLNGLVAGDGLGVVLDKRYSVRHLATPAPYSRYHFEGDPLSPSVRGASSRIEALFGKSGYSRIGLNISEVFLEKNAVVAGIPAELANYAGGIVGVALTVDIDQGYKYRVGNIVIRGNAETKTNVIRANLRLYPGENFNIDDMRRAADRLRRLGWFDATAPGAGVMIQPVYQPIPEHPTADMLDVDILVEVKEGNTGSANFAAGYSPGAGVTVQLSVTKKNLDFLDFPGFTGAGQSISLSIEPKLQERQRFSINFDEPFVFGYPLSSSLELFAEGQDFGPYTRTRIGGRMALGYTFYRDLAVILKYHNFSEEISNIAPSAPFEIHRDEGKSRFGALSVEADYNRLNKYIFPSAGYRLSGETLVAADFFGGNFNMWRIGARAERAFQLAQIDEFREVSLSVYAMALWQDAFSPTDRVPLSNRLTLGSIDISPFRGGRSTTALRGFSRGGVGPSAAGDPVGGNFLINSSAEISFPLQPNFFWLIGFVDAGELVPEIENFDPSGFSASAGFGFRIQLPIFPAPFGVDFGWPIVTQPGNEEELIAINLQLSF